MATCSDMAEQVGDILKGDRKSDVMKTRLCLYSASYPVSAKKMWNGGANHRSVSRSIQQLPVRHLRNTVLGISGDDEDEKEA
jgi:hypothetical protein